MNSFLRRVVYVGVVLISQLATSHAAPPPRDVVIFSDCGTEVDDQWAAAYAMLSPDLRVIGMVSTHAKNLPGGSQASAACLRDVTAHVFGDPGRIPVFVGAPTSLRDREHPYAGPGEKFLIEASKNYAPDHRLIVISIGANTDVGSALLIDPTLAERIQVAIMGFSDDWRHGGLEWNIKQDPVAAKALLNSGAPLAVASKELCTKNLMFAEEDFQRKLEKRKDPLGRWLLQTTLDWMHKNHEPGTPRGHKIIYDVAATAILRGHAKLERRPRPDLDLNDLSMSVPPGNPFGGPFAPRGPRVVAGDPPIYWGIALDVDALWKDFWERIDSASGLRANARR